MFWAADDGTVVNTDHIVAIRPEENGIVTLFMSPAGVTIDISMASFKVLRTIMEQHANWRTY